MCGILALLGLACPAEDMRQIALDSAKRLRHRGPDWSGIYCKGNHIITHERLSVVDVDNGAQPLFSEDKSIVLSVNGEIYNHVELEGQLKKDHVFATKSDCEVLLHLYEEFGVDFLNKCFVNGMFAFVLFDEKTDSFIAARDPIGIIPLYIGWAADGSTWISSEMKALADHCERFEVFPPGHYYDSTKREMVSFWKSQWYLNESMSTTEIELSALRQSLMDSVERHMMADVPFGVLLSGGLDSSLVASIAARVTSARLNGKSKEELAWPRLHSFCIGLEGSPDLANAKKVADFIGTKHHSYVYTVQEGLDALSDVIFFLETYDVTTVRAATPMYLMARKIRSTGVKMVISGEGADEVFGGYLYFHKAPNAEEFYAETVRKLKGLHQYDCLRANKAMSAWGVEARVPFLDRAFLDFSMDIHPRLKMCQSEAGEPRMEKWLLRKAFDTPENPFLPEEVLWRQKEQFSDGVGYSWIDSLRELAEESVTDVQMEQAKFRFPYNTPATKEAYMYREMFIKHFPGESSSQTVPGGKSVACSTPAALAWDESFKSMADPSGRAVAGVHQDAYSA